MTRRKECAQIVEPQHAHIYPKSELVIREQLARQIRARGAKESKQ